MAGLGMLIAVEAWSATQVNRPKWEPHGWRGWSSEPVFCLRPGQANRLLISGGLTLGAGVIGTCLALRSMRHQPTKKHIALALSLLLVTYGIAAIALRASSADELYHPDKNIYNYHPVSVMDINTIKVIRAISITLTALGGALLLGAAGYALRRRP
jgi:hypothetical protein